MVVRDIDVLVEAASRAKVSVTFSVPTLDDRIWRLTEPNTPPPRQRLRALSRLREAGIEAGVGMAPILPGISDKPELMADVVKAARDAGATSIWTNVLYLRPGTREHFMGYLARDWPELVPSYQELYAGRDYLPRSEVEPVRREVAELRHRFEVGDPGRVPRPPGAVERPGAQERPGAVKPPGAVDRSTRAAQRSATRARSQSVRLRPRSSSGVPVQLALDTLQPSTVNPTAPAARARNPVAERAVTGA
jgi:hypothetical protein